MPEFVDVENANRRLFDMLFRHQVYLEGLKAGFAKDYQAGLNKLYGEFAKFIGMTKYTQMDDFNRAELAAFVRRFQTAQSIFYTHWTEELLTLLRQFLSVDVTINKAIMSDVTGLDTASRYYNSGSGDLPSLFGPAAVKGTVKSNDSLWASIQNAPIPANGMTIPQMLSSFSDKSQLDVRNLLMQGYANSSTVRETFDGIVGTSEATYRDGLFGSLLNRNNAVLSTAIQHVSSLVTSGIASIYFNTYTHVSVMDSQTTPICRKLNGQVFIYGKGPLVPLHWGCRSKDIPNYEDDSTHTLPSNFYDWVSSQPEEFTTDAFGSTQPTATNFGSEYATSALTLAQFRSKLGIILQDNEEN
jgi:hypothetical protein